MTVLTRAVSPDDSAIQVDEGKPERLPYRIVIDNEAMLVTGIGSDGLTWIVRRGIGGSDPEEHAEGATVRRAYILYGTSQGAGMGGGDGGPHDHDASYAVLGHDHDYAGPHAHPYAADDHTHEGGDGEHPDLAAHTSLGLASDGHTHDTYATDSDLIAHAGTAHGLSSHAIDGVFHSGTNVLPSAGQKNALAGTSGTPGDANRYVTDQDSRLSDDRDPTAHTHDSEITAAIATHAQTPHGGEGGEAFPIGSGFVSFVDTDPATLLGYGTWASRGAGRVLIGADVGQSGGDLIGSDTHTHAGHSDHAALSHAGATVADHAALSHSAHSVTQPNAHTEIINHTHATDSQGAHVHDEFRNSATTGGLDGWGAGDTSTNTPTLTGYDTGSAGGHTHTAQNPAGGVASITHAGTAVAAHSDHGSQAHTVGQASQHAAQSHSAHDSASNLPLSIVVFLWERTA